MSDDRELGLLERLAKHAYDQHRFLPGVGFDDNLPEWEGLDQWARDSWLADVADVFHDDELHQPKPQGDRPLIDTKLRRWGALGVLEMETGTLGATEDAIRMFLNLQLNTLGPLDRAELTLTRRQA